MEIMIINTLQLSDLILSDMIPIYMQPPQLCSICGK
jgi:hypothetical protein